MSKSIKMLVFGFLFKNTHILPYTYDEYKKTKRTFALFIAYFFAKSFSSLSFTDEYFFTLISVTSRMISPSI